MKHGLCSSVVVPEDLGAFQARVAEFFYTLKPQNDYDAWLIDKISVYSLRIDRAERMERRLRDRRSLRAEVSWDDDVRLEIEKLGGKINSRPAEVVEELRRTPVGCDWLISRWSMLARAADLGDNKWNPAQVSLAFNLLGTPPEFREGHQPGDLLDGHGRVTESGEDRAAFARREIDRLNARREEMAELDQVDRELTRVDLFDESNPELKKLRRYEGTLYNRLRWALGELRYESPHFKPSPEMILRHVTNPNSQPAAGQSAKPEPKNYGDWTIKSIHPPFEIEPDEVPKDGTRPDLFGILLSRQEKKEKKAETRREAKRRKVEKLRA